MAIPTISAITPATGPAAGRNLVSITGTGFQIPTATAGVPTPELPATVSVTFGGVAALRVDVISTTQLLVQVPATTQAESLSSFPPVDVVVTNLDTDGTPIWPLERVTETDGYTYARWGLRPPRKRPVMLNVLRAAMVRWARMVIGVGGVGIAAHQEYVENGDLVTALAEVPSINIQRMGIPRDRAYGWVLDNSSYYVDNGNDTWSQYREPVTRRLVLDMIVAGGSDTGGTLESNYLLDALLEDIEIYPFIDVPGDSDLHPGETNSYQIDITEEPQQASVVGSRRIMAHTLQVSIRGIPVLPTERVRVIYQMLEGYLTTMNMDGENPQTVQLL